MQPYMVNHAECDNVNESVARLNSAEETQTTASLKRSLLLNANNRELHSARAEAATRVGY